MLPEERRRVHDAPRPPLPVEDDAPDEPLDAELKDVAGMFAAMKVGEQSKLMLWQFPSLELQKSVALPGCGQIAWSPDGNTLFVNIFSPARTLAITGPWKWLA